MAKETDTAWLENNQIHYSHGLEEIYQLEKVDPSTIRPFQKEEEPVLPPTSSPDSSLPLGPLITETVPSLLPQEPLEELALPLSLIQRLEAEGITTLGQLWPLVFSDHAEQPVWIRGHSREIRALLQERGPSELPSTSHRVEWRSIRNILLYSVDSRKAAAVFRDFSIPLPEKVEPAAIDGGGLLEEWRCGEVRPFLNKVLREMGEAFLIPWIQKRGGMASMDEIGERLYFVSDVPLLAQQMLPLLAEICEWKVWAWEELLFEAAPGLFSPDPHLARSVQVTFSAAKTYFYHEKAVYQIEPLVEWILRETAKQWLDTSPALIKKILTTSCAFSSSFDSSGRQWIESSG